MAIHYDVMVRGAPPWNRHSDNILFFYLLREEDSGNILVKNALIFGGKPAHLKKVWETVDGAQYEGIDGWILTEKTTEAEEHVEQK